MAYHLEGNDIVINGWEQGIADSPYTGIADMRAVNVVSIPGEASVSFAPTNQIIKSCTGSVVSADASTDIITVTITTGSLDYLTATQAVVFTGASLPAGITAGKIYWAFALSPTTLQIFDNPSLTGTQINITGTGTGTFATVDMGAITYFDKTTGTSLDANGRVWLKNYVFAGNDVTTTTGLTRTVGNGLIWYRGYLFVFYNSRICYIPMSSTGTIAVTAPAWVNEWDPKTGAAHVGTNVFYSGVSENTVHEAISHPYSADTVYITDKNYIVSLQEYPGKTFDPTDTTTYIWHGATNSTPDWALKFSTTESINCLEVLGQTLIIGGSLNYVYTWDLTSTNFNNILQISDRFIKHLLTVNTNTYIFAGKRGRIYVTNSSQAQLYKKLPDHIGGIEAIYGWQNVAYNKNQIYFGVSSGENFGTPTTNYSGLWACDITTDNLRCPTLMSNTAAFATAIWADPTNSISGFSLVIAWSDITNTIFGIDTTTPNAYTSYVSYIDTDIIPIGNFLNKKTFDNLEFKLSAPMTAGEKIKISYRTNLVSSYTLIGETTTKVLSDCYLLNIDQAQWIQFRIQMQGSQQDTPSMVRLYEIRLRNTTTVGYPNFTQS